MAELSRRRRLVFAALPSVLCIIALAGAILYLNSEKSRRRAGLETNRNAWERSYLERGIPVPPAGPRSGYWGSRLGEKQEAEGIGWHERPVRVEGLLDVDADGLQHWSPPGQQVAELPRILVVGGSVAFASYPSSIENAYFSQLGRALRAAGHPVHIDVFASGAWKSAQERRAVEAQIGRLAPDVVVLLNGLNDLTVGSTAAARFGERVETHDGSEWSDQYHAGDYDARVRAYVGHMRSIAALVAEHGGRLVVALQPSILERNPPSPLERDLIRFALGPHQSADAIRSATEDMRRALHGLEREGLLRFHDASRAFNDEGATTFADLWHFGDAGHAILGRQLATALAPVLPR